MMQECPVVLLRLMGNKSGMHVRWWDVMGGYVQLL